MASGKAGSGSSSDPWNEKTDLVRDFTEARDNYAALCDEVRIILKKRIKDAGIEVSAVTCRAKTLGSFLEKLERKDYNDPIAELTDFAGARVVCLYLDDIPEIEKIVNDEFRVVERVDKLAEKGPDEFGYGALHFVVLLGERSSGARYDDLKNLKCEIQVRTVLQDAWAIIDHHLVYKSESDIPLAIQRKLNGLAGLFEVADDQFQRIREQRQSYVQEVSSSLNEQSMLNSAELNIDSYLAYLQWRFPERRPEALAGQAGRNLAVLRSAGYKTLADIDSELDEDSFARAQVVVAELGGPDPPAPASPYLMMVLAAKDSNLLELAPWSENVKRVVRKHLARE